MKKSLIAGVLMSSVLFSGASVAFAEKTGTTTTGGVPAITATNTPKATFDVACVQNAIEKRDTAISIGVDVFATSVKSALTTRKDALKAAWAITKSQDRRIARKAAWAAYNKSAKDAHTALKTARNSAWSTYKTDIKACKASDAGEGPRDNISPTSL